MIILGIDPGSRITGFGLIDNQASRIAYIHGDVAPAVYPTHTPRHKHSYSWKHK